MGEGSAVEPRLAERPRGRGGWGARLAVGSAPLQRAAASVLELSSLHSLPGAGPSLKKCKEVDGRAVEGPGAVLVFYGCRNTLQQI